MELILNLGEPGSGKSTGLRNMPVDKTIIFAPNGKRLPWPGGSASFGDRIHQTDELKELPNLIRNAITSGAKYIVIEDFSHFYNRRITSTDFVASNKGDATFQKWITFAQDIYNALFKLSDELTRKGVRDVYCILLNHTEKAEGGKYTFKSAGKMLNDKIMPESYFRLILHSVVMPEKPLDQRYKYLVNDDAVHIAKSPMGLFKEQYIPNDMYAVIKALEAYEQPEPKPEVVNASAP